MMPSISKEDTSKLHAEVNQIMQQRFALATFAVGIFGAMLAWGLPVKPIKGATIDSISYLVSCTLNAVLAGLFILHLFLKLYARVLTTYLSVIKSLLKDAPNSNTTDWETDWGMWRKEGYTYFGYTWPQVGVFVILVLMSTLYPVAVAWAYGLKLNTNWFAHTTHIVGGVECLLMICLGVYQVKGQEPRCEKHWQSVIKRRYKLNQAPPTGRFRLEL